ncbi:hypothetical protein [Rhizobium sp. SSA_523]|uniref:hypothetical protein n=1 Tax=Rhizobium sp. SSA_523 TaxID=2952477 RepID=UPI002091805A|nr:hypothetical protein [Rhizobium sp. SSA_523]MCO5732125.1 hypothetical protein [Rhizobium sp. SSA_523]WKC25629.1 hypothetical protein QTJ18_16890 [Rhizobium sp. SSA_523]
MRRTSAVLFLAASLVVPFAIAGLAVAGPAPAGEGERKPLADFAAYSIFLVANDNCGELHFDAAKLKNGMERFAHRLSWTDKKRKVQAQVMVNDNRQQFEKDPAAFCASVARILPAYDRDGIRR